jgi:hypothetical protein
LKVERPIRPDGDVEVGAEGKAGIAGRAAGDGIEFVIAQQARVLLSRRGGVFAHGSLHLHSPVRMTGVFHPGKDRVEGQ